MAKAQTLLTFIGGVNKDRIGGNCSVVEHTDDLGYVSRIMFDLGSMFTPLESAFEAAFPNVEEYFDRIDSKTGKTEKALKPVEALFITHAHEDHIGALINYVKMGYQLPPIKAGGFTRNFIRLAFKKEGLPMPEIDKLKAGDNIMIGGNMIVEAVDVSHSIVDSLGFYTLTLNKGKPYAAIMNNGDFLTEEEMPVGHPFNLQNYLNVFKNKPAPTTVICLDSTSTNPGGKERIGFEKAVENTYNVIGKNLDRSFIISPVISRSVQNIAIDIEVARKLHTKIYLEGKWLQIVKDAMTLSGYKDFDDVIYKGTLTGYLGDKRISKKYIVCTGAFAQGLENYEQNISTNPSAPLPLAQATKMALDLHPHIKINKNVLVLARQRIIDEINGKTGPKMLQLMAAQGAKVVMTSGMQHIGGFEEVQMQDSGHVNAEEMTKFMSAIHEAVPDIIAVPIHGNPEQCRNTENIMQQVGVTTHLAENLESFIIGGKTVFDVEPKVTPMSWFAVKLILPDPNVEREIPLDGIKEYYEVNENYEVIRKICEVENVQKYLPKDKGYNHGIDTSGLSELPRRQKFSKPKMPRRMKKMLREKGGR